MVIHSKTTKFDRLNPLPKQPPPALPSLLRASLTPLQQSKAVQQARSGAEQRVRLGLNLFKAAEARLAHQKNLLEQVRVENQALHQQITKDVTKTLQQYDHWLGRIDERFTSAIRGIEQRVEDIEQRWVKAEVKFEQMLTQTQELLERSCQNLARIEEDGNCSEQSVDKVTAEAKIVPETNLVDRGNIEDNLPPPPRDLKSRSMSDQDCIYSKLIKQLRY